MVGATCSLVCSFPSPLCVAISTFCFCFSQVPNDSEMLEFTDNSNIESGGALSQCGSTTSDDTVTERQQQVISLHGKRARENHSLNVQFQNGHSMSPTTPRKNRLMSNLKYCLAPHKHEAAKNDEEKNRGFLLIDQVDADLVLISNENGDQQHTRHAEPCVHEQVAGDTLDVNQIQLMSTTPVTPSLLPPQQPTTHSSSSLPLMNRKCNVSGSLLRLRDIRSL